MVCDRDGGAAAFTASVVATSVLTSRLTRSSNPADSHSHNHSNRAATMLPSLLMAAVNQNEKDPPPLLGDVSAVLVTGALSAALMSAFFVIKRETKRR